MNPVFRALAPVSLVATALSSTAACGASSIDPLRFFVGVTESDGSIKVLMHRPVHTRSIGRGQIEPNGSLILLQKVEDQGRAPYLRRWVIRQVGPGHFAGTMSEATGPVAIEQVGSRYRFSFRMKGNMSVEQWLTPIAGGLSASSMMTVRKFGFAVATSTSVIRKLD